jgi:glycosyltransferase involved in cell wall biosynthesis
VTQRAWIPEVVHVSPTYFSPESVIGGGERYAEELSRAMAERVAVRFVSFGARAYRERVTDRYERVILKSWTRAKMTPFSPFLHRELKGARAVHCYQFNTLSTFCATLFARQMRLPVFVTDLGGGGWTPGYHIDLSRWISGHLPISKYAALKLPSGCKTAPAIYGGVDLVKYPAREKLHHNGTVVFLGRILPHKGVHDLIQGLPDGVPLRIIGPVADDAYLAHLNELARGRPVTFLHGLSDAQIGRELRQAAALVHPTPVGEGASAGVNELLGLAVLEAMASNCPVIVSDAASLPELVVHEVSGIIVPPNSPDALRAAMTSVVADFPRWTRFAVEARKRVEQNFVWPKTVERCMHAYGLLNCAC